MKWLRETNCLNIKAEWNFLSRTIHFALCIFALKAVKQHHTTASIFFFAIPQSCRVSA